VVLSTGGVFYVASLVVTYAQLIPYPVFLLFSLVYRFLIVGMILQVRTGAVHPSIMGAAVMPSV
jgi:hypothetical protein